MCCPRQSLKYDICDTNPAGTLLLHFETAPPAQLRSTHQVCAEHEEADEVDVGQVAPAAELFSGLSVRFWVAASARQRRQHNLLPLLPGGAPTSTAHTGRDALSFALNLTMNGGCRPTQGPT